MEGIVTVFRWLVFVLVALVSTVYAQTQDNGSASTYMGLRGGATFTIHESDDLYYPQNNGWVGGLSLETDLGPNGSTTWAFMLNASYGTYRLATVLQGECLDCIEPAPEDASTYEVYQTISSLEICPVLAIRIGDTGIEALGGISISTVTGMYTEQIQRFGDSVAARIRQQCPECPFLDENTMWNGEHDANTSSGIKFALVGGLQYVLRIASTEIVPAVLYRYGLTASTDVNNTMLRAFDATIALRVPL